MNKYTLVSLCTVALSVVSSATADDASTMRNAYFGDLHVHTRYSPDAYIFSVRTSPDDAYRFALGHPIEHASGYEIKLSGGPLDFYAVTDHAEYLGILEKFEDPSHPLAKSEHAPLMTSSEMGKKLAAFDLLVSQTLSHGVPVGEMIRPEDSASAWGKIQEAANRYYKPGEFTTFIAYEWTLMPDNQNLHRNVIFEGADVPDLPFSRFDATTPEALWAHLDKLRDQGIDSIAIPHNSNLSNGLMFPVEEDSLGRPIGADYADARMRNEPLVEVTQIKGTSETHPSLSPEDEFADFEIYEKLIGKQAFGVAPGSYARQALRDGIQMQANKGFNPYGFGLMGSSDTHNAGAPVEEDDYFGKVGILEGEPRSRLDWRLRWGSSGLAAVWAEENTRESIFAAFRRKETYATTGPRIRVRFFGGWDYDASLHQHDDFIDQAYAKGVPMGGTLNGSQGQSGESPTFLVWAMKDPNGAHLDRVQIIKGWVEDGVSHEVIHDVVLSDPARRDPESGEVAPVGFTVDVANAGYTNSIGVAELSATWSDPDFDASQHAFYYARVIEIPTPRWSTHDAKALNIIPPAGASVAIQERAYTSPIWVRPVVE